MNHKLVLALLVSMWTLAGCDEPGPAERAGASIDEAIDEARDTAEQIQEETEELVDEVREGR